MRRKLLVVWLTLLLAGSLLAGCGQAGDEISPTTAHTLQRDVDAVIAATDASRWDAALAALDRLQTDVAKAQASGGLSDERAAQIRAIRQRVLEDLRQMRGPSASSAPTSTATPTATKAATPSNEPSDAGSGKDGKGGGNPRKKDKGGGKGKGKP